MSDQLGPPVTMDAFPAPDQPWSSQNGVGPDGGRPLTDSLTPWMDLLVQCADVSLRRRLLLEATLCLDSVEAATLWLETGPDSCGAQPGTVDSSPGIGAWHPALTLGPEAGLPDTTEVEADGQEEIEGRRVLVCGVSPHRIALAWAPACAVSSSRTSSPEAGTLDEDEQDTLQALLVLFALTEQDDFLDSVPPALPQRSAVQPGALPSTDHGWSADFLADGSAGNGLDEEARRARHDLRNLLAGILATRELLEGHAGLLGPGEEERFQTILEHECRRAGDLILEGLRGPAQDESADPRTSARIRVRTRPMETVRQTVSAELPLFEAAGIDLILTVDLSRPLPPVALSTGDLSRILHNLLTNAREALLIQSGAFGESGALGAEREPTVVVHLSAHRHRTGDRIHLRVQDNGPGVPAEHLEHVFDGGFSLGKPQGLGLGLAVVHDRVTGAGGRITCLPRDAGGVRFEITLPALP